MELKDYIVMIVPIVVESIIIFYVQAVMTRKLERGGGVVLSMLDRLKDIKYKALKLFSGTYTDQNEAQRFMEDLSDYILYYKANETDLKSIHKDFEYFNNSWVCFVETWNSCAGKELTDDMRNKIYKQKDICFDATDKLLDALRKKY